MGDGGKFQDNLFIFYVIQSGDANANGSYIICLPLTTKLYLLRSFWWTTQHMLIKAISAKSLEDKTIGNHLTNDMHKYNFV